jgi:hypothetical protein
MDYVHLNGLPLKPMHAKLTFTRAKEDEWPICPSLQKGTAGTRIQAARLPDEHNPFLVPVLPLLIEQPHHV